MERVAFDVEELHLGLLDPDARLVGALVDGTVDLEAGLGGCGPDQLDDRQSAFERLAAPVLRDVAEHAVLDLVPLRGARRIVVHFECETAVVGELLQLHLPQADAGAVVPSQLWWESIVA